MASSTSEIDTALEDLIKERERFDRDIEALKRAREILARQNGHTPTKQPRDSTDISRQKWPGLRPAIRVSVAKRAGDFNIDDVIEDLDNYEGKPSIKRVAVSSELWRMNRDGAIELVKKGRPNTYRKAAAK